MKLIQKTILRFKKGNSDKVYEADLLETGDGYLVHFRYGKYGATLREGVKTKTPVVLAQAEKVFHSLIVSKVNKGYHVSEGFDPINNRTIASRASKEAMPVDIKTHQQNLYQRLVDYTQNKADASGQINHYALDRTLWKAGDLRVQNIAPVIEDLLATKFKFNIDEFVYYSMLWALGRSNDANDLTLKLIDQLSGKCPKHTKYMRDEIRFALTKNDELSAKIDPNADCLGTLKSITAFDKYEQLNLSKLNYSDKKYINLLIKAQSIEKEVNQALKKLTIEDINTDYLKKYLSDDIYKKISANKPAVKGLKEAISGVLKGIHNQKLEQTLAAYKTDFNLYKKAIKTINLKAIFNNNEISYITQGRINWLWGDAKSKLRKALNDTGLIENVNKTKNILKSVIQYNDIMSYNGKERIKPTALVKHQQTLDAFNMIDAQFFKSYRIDDGVYSWVEYNAKPEVRCQYDNDIEEQVRSLFEHQLYHLRSEKLKTKDQLLADHQQQILARYRAAKTDKNQRTEILKITKVIIPNKYFMQLFRRLYKIAEFRDDIEVLGQLNHQLEISPSSGHSWYTQKPFSSNTKNYFRRRFVRRLKNIAKFAPQNYTTYAKYVLCPVDDQSSIALKNDRQKQTNFPTLHAFNFILHQNSFCFRVNLQLIWHYIPRKNERKKPEAFPHLWDNALDDLFYILLRCKAQLVDAFAYRRLIEQSEFLDKVALNDWIILVQKPYQDTALLAFDYLQSDWQKIDVMKAILNAQFDEIRTKILEKIDGESLGKQLDLLKLMLLSPYKNVSQFAISYLYTAQDQYSTLSDQLLTDLTTITNEKELTRLIKAIKWLLLHPLKNTASLSAIKQLLEQPHLNLQKFAATLLEKSDFDFEQLKDCYALMIQSEYPDIRAGAISLLAKLDNAAKIDAKDILFDALFNENAALRRKAIRVLKSIKDNDFRLVIFDHILPYLFKSEPHEGFNDDILKLIVGLKPIYKQIDHDLLWRLLQAKSKLAQHAGAVILTSCKPADWSLKQLVLLAKNPTVTVRNWAMASFIDNPAQARQDDVEAMRLLDNVWQDSREQAIAFFKQFEADFWTSQRIISVCDQIYEDVQQFGRHLITTFFEKSQGEQYLIKLSQHPSQNIQLFVSHFLSEYATDKAEIIVNLQPYFQTILAQVNRGRIIKDRIIDFLFAESKKDEAVAKMVIDLFSEQSISVVIADKMRYIQTLFELQQQFNQPLAVIKIIEPPVRSV